MNNSCCRFTIGVVRDVPSPFSRIVATGFYDGPTDGLVECGACRSIYVFEKLDWDDQQDIRVFSLSPVVCDELDGLMESVVVYGGILPIWVVPADVPADFRRRLEVVMRSAAPAEFVVAGQSLLRKLEVWRPIGMGNTIDWFSELSLDRSGMD